MRRLRYSDFEIGPVIGTGTVGTIYEVTNRRTGEPLALKLLSRHIITDELLDGQGLNVDPVTADNADRSASSVTRARESLALRLRSPATTTLRPSVAWWQIAMILAVFVLAVCAARLFA